MKPKYNLIKIGDNNSITLTKEHLKKLRSAESQEVAGGFLEKYDSITDVFKDLKIEVPKSIIGNEYSEDRVTFLFNDDVDIKSYAFKLGERIYKVDCLVLGYKNERIERQQLYLEYGLAFLGIIICTLGGLTTDFLKNDFSFSDDAWKGALIGFGIGVATFFIYKVCDYIKTKKIETHTNETVYEFDPDNNAIIEKVNDYSFTNSS